MERRNLTEVAKHFGGVIFRQNVSWPVEKVLVKINPILRGWVNYFRVGHSRRCFGVVKRQVEKKVRQHLMRVRGRKGFQLGAVE